MALYRQHLKFGVAQGEPITLVGETLVTIEQPTDHAHGFILPVPQQHRINPQGIRIRRKCTRSGTKNGATSGLMIQLHHTLGDMEGMVVRQRNNTGTQPNPLRALGGSSEEQFRGGDRFPASGMMFAAPKFIKSQLFKLNHQI